jgi:AcrR family transcriptional regulator
MPDTGRARRDGVVSARLTAGSNGSRARSVAEIQRARLLAAMAQAACEHGASNITVAHVVEHAGVSRRTFYEIFSDSEDCFVAAMNEAITRVYERVLPAYSAKGRWRERIRAALTALLEFLDAEPRMGRLLVVETLAAGRGSLQRRSQVLAPVIAAIDEGCAEAKSGTAPPPLAAESLAGAVFAVLHGRMLEGNGGQLIDLLNPLMSMIVLPYLGAAAARRELERPMSKRPSPTARPLEGNPLKALEMRLTYRTVCVLSAVAANPTSSNRRIADASGISDQGQISKLLARLEKLGLVENMSAGSAARGEPNAWTLTQSGEEVQGALAAQGAHT